MNGMASSPNRFHKRLGCSSWILLTGHRVLTISLLFLEKVPEEHDVLFERF